MTSVQTSGDTPQGLALIMRRISRFRGPEKTPSDTKAYFVNYIFAETNTPIGFLFLCIRETF